jgi:uncharacterized membrane protein (DUF485 family)
MNRYKLHILLAVLVLIIFVGFMGLIYFALDVTGRSLLLDDIKNGWPVVAGIILLVCAFMYGIEKYFEE